MAILKCKMCGGDLTIQDGMTVAECEYCGTTQTLPKLVSDNIANLYDRANHFRRNNDFDKAEGIYERILAETPEDAEAYWSLVLCRYGIEYVEDPATGKRVPTVNRAQYTSVFDDANYKSAIEHADAIQRRVYEEEAAAINEIQKGILAISQKEEPFDVFICYKETDQNGRRTRDSVIATDLYHQLTNEGFKVFFSRITLEDKLGTAYEPYIFAALNSAKVMVVLGTKPEYFNAVWVKNEWSRYLAIVKQSDGKKVLIPAYRDMDPYDLPEEFSHLQAQDMSKLGFMQDLIRGIKKITGSNQPKPQIQTVTVNSSTSDIAPLLKRMFMYLEDGEWDKANEYSERVLDKEPENGEAYLGLALAKEKLRDKEDFASIYLDGRINADDKNLKRARQFADEKLNAWFNELDKAKAEADAKKAEEKKRQAEEQARKQAEEQAKKQAEEQARSEENKKRLLPIRERIAAYHNLISAGCHQTVGLKADGTVIATEFTEDMELYDGVCDVAGWTDIVAVSAEVIRTVGLKADGTVVATEYIGDMELYHGECNVADWTNIVAVSAGGNHTVGLKADGTVVATKYTGEYYDGQCDVASWTNIVAVSAGGSHTVGLKADGMVVATGNNSSGECDVSGWTNIVAISAGCGITVGLKADGTVVAVGYNGEGLCDVSGWKDIVAVSAGEFHTVGLKADGTVVAVGDNGGGQCNISDWKDIVAVSAGFYHTVGLKADGTVIAIGENDYGQCNVSGWKLFKTEREKEADYIRGSALQKSGEEKNLAEAASLFRGLNDFKDSVNRAVECDSAYERLKTEREAREREEKTAELNSEKSALQTELANLKGLFTGKRRRQIEARLAEIELELKKL